MIFVSIFAYSFGKKHYPNIDGAIAREMALGTRSDIPCFRTLHRLRTMYEVMVFPECSTLIGPARCRAAGNFLRSTCDGQVSIDDDVDASAAALEQLVFASGEHRIALAAMRKRVDRTAGEWDWNVDCDEVTGLHPFPVRSGGLALAYFPRSCVERVALDCRDLEFDEDGQSFPGFFLQKIDGRRWVGEDVAFCQRAAAAGVGLVGIAHHDVVHAGIPSL